MYGDNSATTSLSFRYSKVVVGVGRRDGRPHRGAGAEPRQGVDMLLKKFAHLTRYLCSKSSGGSSLKMGAVL